jgi:4-amino-4-deoxy-L-arabinose transferase-like glycosyltransferase
VTPFQHAGRMGLLMVATAVLLTWALRHNEACFADGLRYIRQAEQIDRGAWRDALVNSIDHPLHPLGIVMARGLVGGDGPVAWQRAAVGLAFGCVVLLVIPLYLLARKVFGDQSAWLGCVLVMANPLLGAIVANVLSESSFLLFWTWGMWAAVRFLREGRFGWLPLALGFGVLSYLSRPEGLLLPMAIVATLALLPLSSSTRINWPRWWGAVGFLMLGLVMLAGPYMAVKGRLGTKPGIARVLGLAPASPPNALERERPLPSDQSSLETYRLATERMLKVIRGVVWAPLLPLAALGLLMIRPSPARARLWLFLGVVLLASAVGLVRLHATTGYCTVRHGLIPGSILLLAAAHGATWLMGRLYLPGKWLGLGQESLRPGPAVWAVLLALVVIVPRMRDSAPLVLGPFQAYRDAGDWLAQNSRDSERILDLTDWSLFFSQRPGYRFAQVYDAPADPKTRWVVARAPHLEGRWNYSKVVRDLVGGRAPVAVVPTHPEPGQVQVQIFDRYRDAGGLARSEAIAAPETRRR